MNRLLTLAAAALAAHLSLPLAPGAARAAGPGTAEAHTTLRLEVSLGEKKLHVHENGELVGSYTVAVGKPKHPTPRGEFQVRRVILNPRWVPPRAEWAKDKTPKNPGDPDNPMGRAKIFFKDPDYYIHGTNDEKSLGSAASHGCIRMANGDVVEIAKLVMRHGGQPRDPGWFRRVLNRVTQSQEVRLTDPVVLVVRS